MLDHDRDGNLQLIFKLLVNLEQGNNKSQINPNMVLKNLLKLIRTESSSVFSDAFDDGRF